MVNYHFQSNCQIGILASLGLEYVVSEQNHPTKQRLESALVRFKNELAEKQKVDVPILTLATSTAYQDVTEILKDDGWTIVSTVTNPQHAHNTTINLWLKVKSPVQLVEKQKISKKVSKKVKIVKGRTTKKCV